MLQCVAVCCSVLLFVAVPYALLAGLVLLPITFPLAWWRFEHVAVCCSALQCVAVCCSVLQCVAVSVTGLYVLHYSFAFVP